MTYDINTIYTKYKQLTKKQRQQLLAALQSQGINIVKIEAYEYADAPGIKHLFFYFAENSRLAFLSKSLYFQHMIIIPLPFHNQAILSYNLYIVSYFILQF